MKKSIKEMFKMFLLTVILSAFFYLIDFSASFVGQVFSYGLICLIVPICINSGELGWSEKFLYSLFICFVAVTVTLIFNGIGNTLFNNVIVMGVVVVVSIFINFRQAKKPRENKV